MITFLGFISKAQVKEEDGNDFDEDKFNKMDKNGDGKLSFEEMLDSIVNEVLEYERK